MTASSFAWSCVDAGDFPPPEPKRGPRYGPDDCCYLCGGPTDGVGWHLKDAVGMSFTDTRIAQSPDSSTMCQSCVAVSKADGWAQAVAAHPERGLPSHFPQKGDAPPRAWNWLYNSHLCYLPAHHECPSRARWCEILLNPPEPPFLAVIATSGKKQLIFKSRIALDRAAFPVQFEDTSIVVAPDVLGAALADFEWLYRRGFSKDSVLTGHYHPKSLQDASQQYGLHVVQQAECRAADWRQKAPQTWAVCHFIAQREEKS